MSLLQAFFLGIIQGITEFLPISSSGHLIVFENIFGLSVAELFTFDIAVHAGSLLAIVWYFYKQWKSFFVSTLQDIRSVRRWKNSQFLLLIIGTIPAIIIGLLWKDSIEVYFRNTLTVALFWIIIGILLYFSVYAKEKTDIISPKQSLLIGIVQACAILPGISRSGSTILTAMFLGIRRQKAAEFSFFLGAIAIFGAMILTLLSENISELFTPVTIIGFLSSSLSSLFAVSWLMKILKSGTLRPFAYYLWGASFLVILFTLMN